MSSVAPAPAPESPAPRPVDVVPARMVATTPAGRLFGYARREFVRTVRMVDATFFTVLLPVALYLMFGAMSSWGDQPLEHGNVAAYTMTGMAVYGAITATTSIAGSAAVERQMGWGRQLSLTALTAREYVLGKCLVALATALLPTLAVLGAGALTGARMDDAWRWLATAGIVLACALPFALFGLAAALLFRSEAAVSAASGMLVVFAFLGGMFMPLSGVMQEIGRFTPLYGAGMLARWPQIGGAAVQMGPEAPTPADPLWMPLLSILAWTIVFGAACLMASRSRTARA